MICQKKNKRLCVFCSFCLLLCLVVQCLVFCVPSYASETEYVTVENYLTDSNFSDIVDWVCRNYAILPDSVTAGNLSVQGFYNYLTSIDKEDLKQENVTITGLGGGRGYDIPQDVRQEIVNYVQNNYIAENPLTYYEATITSYNFLNPSLFVNAIQFTSLKEFIKNAGGYVLILKAGGYQNMQGTTQLVVVPRQNMVDFVGTVNNGIFTTVNLYYNWSSVNLYNMRLIPNAKYYTMNVNGQITEGSFPNVGDSSLINGSTPTNNKLLVMSNYDKNERVYVFKNLNALKNYNSGLPQPYYLPSNSNISVPLYDTFTQEDLNRAGQFYNSIVNNVTTGQSPDDITKLVDSTIKSGLDLGGDSDSGSTGILGGLAEIITGATGAISPIKELVNNDLKEFVGDLFDWLPASVVSLWIAGITFGVFFGVLKVIRG